MGIAVTQGLIEVVSIDVLHDHPACVVYLVNTEQKRPEVISWNSDSLTVLPVGKLREGATAADYTVIRFPERKWFSSAYLEERYGVYFMQFSCAEPKTVWEKNG